MRCATPQPCMGSSESVWRISRSSVPCSSSVEVGICTPRHSTGAWTILLSNVKGYGRNVTSFAGEVRDPFQAEHWPSIRIRQGPQGSVKTPSEQGLEHTIQGALHD